MYQSDPSPYAGMPGMVGNLDPTIAAKLPAWERANAAQIRYPAAYGSFGGEELLLKERQPNQAQMVLNLLAAASVPSLIFFAIYWLMAFQVHYTSPTVVYAAIGVVAFFLLALAYASVSAVRKRALGDTSVTPVWSGYIFLTGTVALIAGCLLGQQNFTTNMQPFYDVQNLNEYFSVDPSVYRGNQLMDSGKLHFIEGAHIDRSYAMGFQNFDTYCVAPIAGSGTAQLETYDFWAVGTNCCTSGAQPDFRCGEYGNPDAKAGMRLMKEDQRAFFRLAVEQAEAAFNIKANHPIFLYWLENPDQELAAYQGAGNSSLMRCVCMYVAAQFVITILFFAIVGNKL